MDVETVMWQSMLVVPVRLSGACAVKQMPVQLSGAVKQVPVRLSSACAVKQCLCGYACVCG
jgi:hypothetical protein